MASHDAVNVTFPLDLHDNLKAQAMKEKVTQTALLGKAFELYMGKAVKIVERKCPFDDASPSEQRLLQKLLELMRREERDRGLLETLVRHWK